MTEPQPKYPEPKKEPRDFWEQLQDLITTVVGLAWYVLIVVAVGALALSIVVLIWDWRIWRVMPRSRSDFGPVTGDSVASVDSAASEEP